MTVEAAALSRTALFALAIGTLGTGCGIHGAPPQSASVAASPCELSVTQADMNACWSGAERQSEMRIGLEVTRLLARVEERSGAETAGLVHETQSRWERYAASVCLLYARRYEGGSGAAMAQSACRWRVGQQRIEELDRLLSTWSN